MAGGLAAWAALYAASRSWPFKAEPRQAGNKGPGMWAGQACGATQRESFIFHGTENHWLQTQPPPWADRQCLACASLQGPLYQSLLGVGWRPPLPSNPPALPKLLAPFIWFLRAGVGGRIRTPGFWAHLCLWAWHFGPQFPHLQNRTITASQEGWGLWRD